MRNNTFSAAERARAGQATSIGEFLASEPVRFTLGALAGLISLCVLCTLMG